MTRQASTLRRLGVAGLWLAALLTVGAWLGVFLALSPIRAALAHADVTLTALDRQLEGAQATLAPFDVLSRPETLDAAHTLTSLAETAQRTPLLALVFAPGTLDGGAQLAREWEATLRDRPPLPALQDARRSVNDWHTWVLVLGRRLTWLGVGAGLLLTLLCAWFAAGQVALIRLAAPDTPSSMTVQPD